MDSAVSKESTNGHQMRSFAVLTRFTKLIVAGCASLTPVAKVSASEKVVIISAPSTIGATRQRKQKLDAMLREKSATEELNVVFPKTLQNAIHSFILYSYLLYLYNYFFSTMFVLHFMQYKVI